MPHLAEAGIPGSFRLAEADLEESFPTRLRLTRRSLGLTQAQLADWLRVDESTVWGWENGAHKPLPRHRKRVIELCRSAWQTLG